jgi:hypothetical protein
MAVSKLEQAQLITCRRGHITILDRSQLERHAGECYRAAKVGFDRMPAG